MDSRIIVGMKTLIFVALLVVGTSPAYAIATIKQYREYKAANGQDWRNMVVYIVGLEEGFAWANVYVETNNSRKVMLYCPPATLHMNADLDISIIDEEIELEKRGVGALQPLTDDSKLEPLFLMGLVHKYPCK